MAAKRGDDTSATTSSAGLIAQLAQSRRSLMGAIAGLDEESFRRRPAPGEWSAAEILAHLLTVERLQTGRLRKVLTEDNPVIAWVEDDEIERQAASDAKRMPAPQIIHGLLAQRRDVSALLGPLDADALARPYEHERLGARQAMQLFQHIVAHEEQHAAQIRALRGQVAAGHA